MKNRGLAIIFGLLPGAGHMYLGKMKRGLTLMILFWGIIGVSGSMGFALPLFALPVIWFYAFFDCLNLSAMDNGSLERAPDEWAFGWFSEDSSLNKHKDWFQKKNLWLGWGLILIGAATIYSTFGYQFISFLEDVFHIQNGWVYDLYNKIPQILIAAVIIILGVKFIVGDKKNTDSKEDVNFYIGEGKAHSHEEK